MALLVLILPMRNGNYVNLSLVLNLQPSSYPTYEEWKPIIAFSFYIYDGTCVLILPMRNGNIYYFLLNLL